VNVSPGRPGGRPRCRQKLVPRIRLEVVLPPAVHARATVEAAHRGLSVGDWIAETIEVALAARARGAALGPRRLRPVERGRAEVYR
jgi:hypothetical protein